MKDRRGNGTVTVMLKELRITVNIFSIFILNNRFLFVRSQNYNMHRFHEYNIQRTLEDSENKTVS